MEWEETHNIDPTKVHTLTKEVRKQWPEETTPMGHGERKPKRGFYPGIQDIQPPASFAGCRPEEQIRTFDGMLRLIIDTSPDQLLAACREIFPMSVNAGPTYSDAWGNFGQWVHKARNEGLLFQQVHMGGRLYTQLRIIQTVKDHPGVKMQDIREALAQPLKREDPFIQAAMKSRKKQ